MRRAQMAWVLFAIVGLGVGAACTGSANGGGAGGASGGPGGQSCQSLRLCALDCGDDACATETCKPRGSASAQAAFQALLECTKTAGGCASPNDINCLCAAQCLQDPPCAAELDSCVGATADPICEVNCH